MSADKFRMGQPRSKCAEQVVRFFEQLSPRDSEAVYSEKKKRTIDKKKLPQSARLCIPNSWLALLTFSQMNQEDCPGTLEVTLLSQRNGGTELQVHPCLPRCILETHACRRDPKSFQKFGLPPVGT